MRLYGRVLATALSLGLVSAMLPACSGGDEPEEEVKPDDKGGGEEAPAEA